MLRSIRLQNYRGFEDTTIKFRQFSLLIGKNSAGKSTVLESLRLLSLVMIRLQKPSFESAPEWTELDPSTRGIRISLSDSEIDLNSIGFLYSDSPTTFEAIFDDKTAIKGYLAMNESLFATIYPKSEFLASNAKHLRQFTLPSVYVMPQVSTLQKHEKLISESYVDKHQFNPVSRLHFRNQIRNYPEYFEIFKERAQESWSGLRIRETVSGVDPITLTVEEHGFPAEVSMMGSGLQVWLQMLWFLSRVSQTSIVALDEPDVYLHADLQRKLISQLRDHQGQVIIASHSVEIMSECKSNEIVIIDRNRKVSSFADSNAAVQKVIEGMGSVHNIQLARLWGAKKCLFVEGKDMDILRHIVRVEFPKKYVLFTNLPNFTTEGWSGLKMAQGFAATFVPHHEGNFRAYCILDRDYRSDLVIEGQLNESEKNKLKLFVWMRKEIENYLLLPNVILRAIRKKVKEDSSMKIDHEQISEIIGNYCDGNKDRITDALAEQLNIESTESKRLGLPHANTRARQYVTENWRTLEDKASIVSGKEIFAHLNKELQRISNLSIGPIDVARELRKGEIDREVTNILHEILQ